MVRLRRQGYFEPTSLSATLVKGAVELSPLLEHKRLAHELSKSRGESDLLRNWFAAQVVLVERRAFEFSQRRKGFGSADSDWQRAEASIRWEEWIERTGQLPYLATEAAQHLPETAALLTKCESDGTRGLDAIRCAVVLDGGPEYSQARFEFHRENCVDPRGIIDRKQATFIECCREVTASYEGRLVTRPAVEGNGRAAGEFFQDACAVVFTGPRSHANALACVLRLQRLLAGFNDVNVKNWTEELHARVTIACTWDAVLHAIPLTKRDEIALQAPLFSSLHMDLQRVLLANGLRLFMAEEEQD